MILDGGRKPEYPERTHAYTGKKTADMFFSNLFISSLIIIIIIIIIVVLVVV